VAGFCWHCSGDGNTTGTIQVTSSGTTGVFPSTGAGLELAAGVASDADLIQSYNRGTSAFRTIQYRALSHSFFAGSSGTVSLQVNSSGVGVNITPGGTSLAVVAASVSTVGAIIRGVASQTADLQQWQNSAGTVLAKVTASGNLVGTSSYTAKTASYTFASGDEGNIFSMNNAATQQFNIPTDATFNFAVGTEINVFWITGAGQPTIGAVTPGTTTVISTGATSATPKLRVANSGATCKKLAANSWIVFGDLA